MHKTSFLLLFLCFGQRVYCQNPDSVRYMDSLMAKVKTEKLAGEIPTSYSQGYRNRAATVQKAFEGAADYYQKLYHRRFNLKLAVLDSAQWLKERAPWGFLSYENGWAQIPARVNYADLLQIYGITDKKGKLDSLLLQQHVNREELISSVYLVYSLHELGHYFIDDLNQCDIPDMFANELIATYFSYHYFEKIHSRDLTNLLLFSRFIAENYPAKFRQIESMDKLYMKMPIQNFKWFHCNIVLLSGKIHHQMGGKFITYYLKAFAKGKERKLSTRRVIAMLDRQTKGKVSKWAAALARNR